MSEVSKPKSDTLNQEIKSQGEEIPDEVYEKALGILNHLDFETETLQEKVDYLVESMLQPAPKYKIRELIEKTAHKFLMGNFVNEIPPIEKMPLDETARWMQIIEKLLYSTIQKYDKLKESDDEKNG